MFWLLSASALAQCLSFQRCVSRELRCLLTTRFYTQPHSNGGVLWYHIGCLWGCTSACLPDNNLRMSVDFTKFGVCIDILEIWFGIADGQISLIFDSYRPEIHQFFHFWMINLVNMNGFSLNLVCALILWKSGFGLLIGKFRQLLTELSACDTSVFSFPDNN